MTAHHELNPSNSATHRKSPLQRTLLAIFVCERSNLNDVCSCVQAPLVHPTTDNRQKGMKFTLTKHIAVSPLSTFRYIQGKQIL